MIDQPPPIVENVFLVDVSASDSVETSNVEVILKFVEPSIEQTVTWTPWTLGAPD